MIESPFAFSALLRVAWRLSVVRWSLIGWGLCFGAVNAASLLFSKDFPALDPSTWPTDPEAITPWFIAQMPALFILLAVSASVYLLEALLRGPLILDLENSLRSLRKQTPLTRPLSRWLRASGQSLALDLAWSGLVTVLAVILLSPSTLALTYNPAVSGMLARTGLSLWLILMLLAYAIKECALYYYLLGRVSFGPAIELGRKLLFGSLWPILLFGFLLFGLTSVFTFILNSVMLSMTEMFPQAPLWGQAGGMLFLLAPYVLFAQALRLVFFHVLADTKTPPAPEKVVLAREEISETPA